MPSSKPSIAWFGATGGCTIAALALAVKDGYPCYALVRSENKLTELLATRGINANDHPNLVAIKGDMLDQSAIQRVLSRNASGPLVDIIVTGVGGTLKIKTCPPGGTLDNPTICETSTRNIVAALRSLTSGGHGQAGAAASPRKPYLVVVSTTGINEPHRRDVPIAMLPMYNILLPVPHEDKRKMEAFLAEELRSGPEKRAFDGYLLVRPSLLTNGPYTEVKKIRVGTDVNPAVGYTISRNDVGLWIYETVIKGDQLKPGASVASITY